MSKITRLFHSLNNEDITLRIEAIDEKTGNFIIESKDGVKQVTLDEDQLTEIYFEITEKFDLMV